MVMTFRFPFQRINKPDPIQPCNESHWIGGATIRYRFIKL